jgi:hypothetical protein
MDPATAGAATLELPEGDALTAESAARIVRARLTRVVVVAGSPGSGKTTLLTSLYESLQEAPVAGFLFAGSETLVGFERRCHEARQSSGRATPHTKRTPPAEGLRFLHLRLARSDGTRVPDLLLSDISGEIFDQVKDSTEDCKALTVLLRADHLVLLIDGEKLISPVTRYSAHTDARSLLRSIIEAKMLSSNCTVDVVFTKWDLIEAVEQAAESKAYIRQIETQFTTLFKAHGAALRFCPVAARPSSDVLQFAHGIPRLLQAWLEPTESVLVPRIVLGAEPKALRAFEDYGASYFTSQGAQYDVRRI